MATCLSACKDTMGTVIAATASAVSVTNNIKIRKKSNIEHKIQNLKKRTNSKDADCESPSKQMKVEYRNISTNDNMVMNIGGSQSHCNMPILKDESITIGDLKVSENTDSDENDDVNVMTFEETLQSIDNKLKQQQNFKRKKVKEQTAPIKSKKQRLLDKSHEIEEIQSELSSHIANFISQKMEKEREKVWQEYDAQFTSIKAQMKEENLNLMMEIKKCNVREKKLLREKSMLKEKLKQERKEFFMEFNLVNLSKQNMKEELEAKIRDQEEISKRYHQALELVRQKMEELEQAKEMEIKEIIEKKEALEEELKSSISEITEQKTALQEELNSLIAVNQIKNALQIEYEKLHVEKLVNDRMELLADENRKKIETLNAAIERAQSETESLRERDEQSREEITSLRQQLDQVKKEVQNLEKERHLMLENQFEQVISSRQSVLSDLALTMESELQCSICVEMFVSPVILSCSHTFCKFCITTHMMRNNECPLCRVSIESQCKNLILDTFVEKMVATWSEEMKEKRREVLEMRSEEMAALDEERERQMMLYSRSSLNNIRYIPRGNLLFLH